MSLVSLPHTLPAMIDHVIFSVTKMLRKTCIVGLHCEVIGRKILYICAVINGYPSGAAFFGPRFFSIFSLKIFFPLV